MEIEFAFREEKSNVFGIVFRPVVDLVYISGGKEVEGTAYIDSGADISLIPLALGEDLGLKIEKGDSISEMSGIGKGGVPIVIKTIKLRVGDKIINTRVAWALVEEVPLLLGRIDIFNIFDITFKRNEKTLFSEQRKVKKEAV